MKKILSLIIGAIGTVTIWSAAPVYAQNTVPNNCDSTLYDDEFRCKAEGVFSYCTTGWEDLGDAIFGNTIFANLEIYRNTYCDTIRNDNDEIYEILAEQFSAEDPAYDNPDLVKFILEEVGPGGKSMVEFVGEVDTDHRDAFFSEVTSETVQWFYELFGEKITKAHFDVSANLIDQQEIQSRFQRAFDQEKIIYQSQQSLKSQFETREMWTSGTLADSPFDLIVDLNLIEIVLFGSMATWTTDVWSYDHPNLGDLAGAIIDALTDDDTAPETGTTAAEDAPETAEGTGMAVDDYGDEPAQIECVSDDLLDELFEEDEIIPGLIIPEAQPGDAGVIPPDCGNGILDDGEACDNGMHCENNQPCTTDDQCTPFGDGLCTTRAGDGCSNTCKEEIGPTLSCIDPEALTLTQFEMAALEEESDGAVSDEEGAIDDEEDIPIDCPPGSTAVDLSELPGGQLPPPQSANYPGPFIGGVLKTFPPSNRPDCPAGWSPIDIVPAAGSLVPTDVTELRCIPAELCADMNDMRDFLFPGWETDPDKKPIAEAVEAIICIEVKEIMRPKSPYPPEEGCVDCHILAMIDIMDKMLSKNVNPLENPKQAWGLSSRFGVNFTIDLSMVVAQGKVALAKPQYSDHTPEALAAENRKRLDMQTKHQIDPLEDVQKATVVANDSAAEIIKRYVQIDKKAEKERAEALKNYKMTSEGQTVDRQFHKEIPTLLTQMLESFKRLQDHYAGLALAVKFQEKEQCE